MSEAVQQLRYDEHDRMFVTNGSRICPHPSLCDQKKTETFEEYVRRHCMDHQLGDLPTLEDAERNLGVWCMFFLERHILGNLSLGTGSDIVAAWEPCWEDAEYLANWSFADSDTEQNTPMGNRSFRLKPYAERDHAGAVFKRFKKYTKVRRTQKTSKGKALVTFEHLHARFVLNNSSFRVLVISASSTLARDHYLQPLADMWDNHENLQRLYGTTTYTKRHAQLMANARSKGVEPDEDMIEAETRRIGLLARGSRPKDTLRMRWVVKQKNSSGKSAISVKVMGMTTISAGNRWDLIIVDDPVVPENSANEQQRRKVERKIADLRKQGDANARIVFLNTPQHIDDASSRIDKDQGDQWHIMYRPAMWFDEHGVPIYYWEKNALDPGNPQPGEPAANDVWTPELIEAERTQPDFFSQILLQPKNPDTSQYEEDDFPIVDPAKCPIEVVAGLGGQPIPEDQRSALRADGTEIRGIVFVDTSGNEHQSARGDETFVVAMRFGVNGDMYIVRLAAGQMNVGAEQAAVYEAWHYSGAQTIEYETSGGHEKFVKTGYAEFQSAKSKELKRPIAMPMYFRNARSTKSKYVRVPQMFPFIKAGRLKILSNAAPPQLTKKFVNQWVDWGSDPHDDGADAASRVLYYIDITEQYTEAGVAAGEPQAMELTDDGYLIFPAELMQSLMNGANTEEVVSWGARG